MRVGNLFNVALQSLLRHVTEVSTPVTLRRILKQERQHDSTNNTKQTPA
ncbi:MAG: hypothetical protein ACI93R_001703 [Flavobacteriales bacterium]|jgi:hypothetical protein